MRRQLLKQANIAHQIITQTEETRRKDRRICDVMEDEELAETTARVSVAVDVLYRLFDEEFVAHQYCSFIHSLIKVFVSSIRNI